MGKKDDGTRKLALRKQTMRTLSANQLDKVAGGYMYTQEGWQCDTTICDSEANWGGGGGWGGDYGGGWGGDYGGGWGGDWGW